LHTSSAQTLKAIKLYKVKKWKLDQMTMAATKKRTKVSGTWLTPESFYKKQDERFDFSNFDPCPPSCDLTKFDGLKVDWKDRTFFNPEYDLPVKTAFVLKALEQSKRCSLIVGLIPPSTGGKLFHEIIKPNFDIEFLQGRLGFEGIDNTGLWCNPFAAGYGKAATAWRDANIQPGRIGLKRPGQIDLMLIIIGK
jgi:hypothetical protein